MDVDKRPYLIVRRADLDDAREDYGHLNLPTVKFSQFDIEQLAGHIGANMTNDDAARSVIEFFGGEYAKGS